MGERARYLSPPRARSPGLWLGYAYASAALNEFIQRYVNRPLSFLLSFTRDWKFTRGARCLSEISDAIDHK